jgi:hypothetical protein
MKFEIGQSVEIQTRLRSNLLGIEFENHLFKGEIINNPKWLDNDYISIHTDNKEYPISHIHKKFIIGFDFGVERSIIRVFKVTSKLNGKTYNVVSKKGNVSCDCTGFQFRRVCKHSTKIKNLLVEESA